MLGYRDHLLQPASLYTVDTLGTQQFYGCFLSF